MSQRDTLIHLLAGGVAGTAGAVVTCPLEVVKTRLQSSNPVFGNVNKTEGGPKGSGGSGGYTSSIPKGRYGTSPYNGTGSAWSSSRARFSTCVSCGRSAHILAVARGNHASQVPASNAPKLGLVQCLRLIIEKEGPRALFKGLGPNLVGVAPSRAIYFCAYSQSKKTFNQIFPTESPVVHICSAATAGFVACTATNPVWFVKTRLQLDQNQTQSAREAIRRIYAQGGILGFYKGITASYMGISETVIHFVIYEAVKKRLQQWTHNNRTLADEEAALANPNEKSTADFVQFMAAGAISKTVASCIAYPHEVARTRLREEGTKYRNFWQTLSLVAKEEGYRGLYRGLGTQLIRQIPNTAIMMSTYEATVYLLSKYLPNSSDKAPMESMEIKDMVNRDDTFDEFNYTELPDPSSSSSNQRS